MSSLPLNNYSISKPPRSHSTQLPSSSSAILSRSFQNPSLNQSQSLQSQPQYDSPEQQNHMRLELELLRQKYSEAVQRLSSTPNESYSIQLEKDLSREKEKALTVILKLEGDLQEQKNQYEIDKARLENKMDSISCLNAQLQSDLVDSTQILQKEKFLYQKEKEDAEQVIKQMRKHIEGLEIRLSQNPKNEELQIELNQIKSERQLLLHKSESLQQELSFLQSSIEQIQNDIQEEKKNMAGQIKLLEQEKNDLHSVLDNTKAQLFYISTTKQNEAFLNEEKQRFEIILKNIQNRCEQLECELEQNKKESQEVIGISADRLGEIYSLKAKLEDQERNQFKYTNEIGVLQTKQEWNQKQISSLQKEIEVIKSQSSNRLSEIQQLKSQLERTIEERQNALSKYEKSVEDQQENQRQIISCLEENKKLKEKLDKLEDNIKNVSDSSNKDLAEIQKCKSEISTKRSEVEEFQKKIISLNKEIQNLHIQNQTITSQAREKEQKWKNFDEEKNNLIAKYEKVLEELKQIKEQSYNSQVQIDSMGKETERLKSQNQLSQVELKSLQEKYQDSQMREASQQQQISALIQQIDTINYYYQKKESEMDKVMEEKQLKSNEQDNMCHLKEGERNTIQNTLEILQIKLNEAYQSNSALEEKLRDKIQIQKQFDLSKMKIQELIVINLELSKELQEMNSQRECEKQYYDEIECKYQILKDKVTYLNAKYNDVWNKYQETHAKYVQILKQQLNGLENTNNHNTSFTSKYELELSVPNNQIKTFETNSQAKQICSHIMRSNSAIKKRDFFKNPVNQFDRFLEGDGEEHHNTSLQQQKLLSSNSINMSLERASTRTQSEKKTNEIINLKMLFPESWHSQTVLKH